MINQDYQILLELAQQKPTKWEDISHPEEITRWKEFCKGNELHVWQCSTSAPFEVISSFYSKVSAEEKIKAGRFRFSRDQHRYVISHGLLRTILGAYVEEGPSELIFEKTNSGKPFLATKTRKGRIQFNMTHSEDVVCYIMSRENEVGIDIEYVKPNFDWYSIAKVYFTFHEMSLLESLPGDEQIRTFFTLWTRKEALLKATGEGLNGIKDMGSSAINPIKSKFTLFSFKYGEDYQGAFAVNSETPRIRFFDLSSFNK
jgi:4'-phosphopantetheinyl transferase